MLSKKGTHKNPFKFTDQFSNDFVENTHFKAGAKIHLEHFLFANRILELNIEAEKIAIILLKEIKAIYYSDEKLQKSKVTIVGYQLYTELLLSITQHLLEQENIYIDYKVISNEREKESLYEQDKIENGYVLLLIPFGTTLQHVFEIKKYVEEYLISKPVTISPNNSLQVHVEILEPILVIFLITDGKIDEFAKTVNSGAHFLNIKFGWGIKEGKNQDSFDIENRIIHVWDNSSNYPKVQNSITVKYLYFFESTIHDASDCNLCTPKNAIEEKPLLLFDERTQLPNMSFGYPQIIVKKDNPCPVLEPSCFINGHTVWNNTCFLHWIDNKIFYKDNMPAIKVWIKSLQKQLRKIVNDREVIIFSSGKTSKSDFLFYLNRELFSNSASIIEYNINENILENFGIFYNSVFQHIGDKIFFYGEDIIDSDSNFKDFEYFLSQSIKTCNTEFVDKNDIKVFAGVFTLINRMNRNSEIELRKYVNDNIFSFYKLHLHPLKDPAIGCPLCNKLSEYDLLKSAAMLDYLKGNFGEKKSKILRKTFDEKNRTRGKSYLEKNYLTFIEERKIFDFNPIRINKKEIIEQFETFKNLGEIKFDEKLLYIIITNALFDVLCNSNDDHFLKLRFTQESFDENEVLEIFAKITKTILNDTQVCNIKNKLKDRYQKTYDERIEKIIIKLLAFPPFALYKRLREIVLKYIVLKLQDSIITNCRLPYSFEGLLSLKFYLNRAIALNSNYILREDTLRNIQKMFTSGNYMESNVDRTQKISSLIKFYEECYKLLDEEIEFQNIFDSERDNYTGLQEFFNRIKDNLSYRIDRIQNFNYFIVSSVKQLIYNNASASLILEKSLNKFFNEYKIGSEMQMPNIEKIENNDFFYLWRVLKLENVFVLSSFLNKLLISHDKFTVELERLIGAIRIDIRNRKNLYNYIDFYTLFQNQCFSKQNYEQNLVSEFLEISQNTSEDIKYHGLADTFLLMFFLKKIFLSPMHINNKDSQFGLEDKLIFILEHICNILGFSKENSLLSAFVAARRSKSGSIEKNNVYSQVGEGRINSFIEENGLVYTMLEGLSLQKNSSPQTFVEVVKKEGKWVGIRKNYFSLRTEVDIHKSIETDGNMGYYDNDKKHNYIFFFRFSEIIDYSSSDIGNAVFVIATKQENTSYYAHPDRLRLLLILRPILDEFINKNFQNDSFLDLLLLKQKNNDINAQTHGIRRYMNQIATLIDKVKSGELNSRNVKGYEFVFELLTNQIVNFFDYASGTLNQKILKEDWQKRQKSLPYSIKNIRNEIKQKTAMIFSLESLGNGSINSDDYKIGFDFINCKNQEFIFGTFILDQIFPEIIINIKNRFRKSIEDKNLLIKWTFEISSKEDISELVITIKNTVDVFWYNLYRTGKKKPKFKENGGLEMCKKLLELDNGTLSIDFSDPYFITSIRIPFFRKDKNNYN